MLKIAFVLFVIFTLIFIFLFTYFYKVNKKEEKKDHVITLVMVAILFSLMITFIIALFLFLIIGSTNVIDKLFSLGIDRNQIIIIAIFIMVYLMTIDNFFEMVFEYILSVKIYALFSVATSRVAAFYIIGIIMNLNNTINLTVSIGISFILFLIDALFYLRKK